MQRRTSTQTKHLLLVTALLLFQFFLRAHHITGQESFIDEGYHVSRAVHVWDFDSHPARTANGKLLLYFWLGLFDLQPITALYVSRTAMALFSLVGGAAIYAVGRQIGNHTVGALALGLYAILPLALFFERMALADPFAAVFASLLVWRCILFARHPRSAEGLLVGILCACAMLAKLTMGLIPLLPGAIVLFFSGYPRQIRRYLPGFILAAGVVILLWLPILIPAWLARNTDPFVLINPENLQQIEEAAPVASLWGQLPQLSAYTSGSLLAVGAIALVWLIVQERTRPAALVIFVWVALIVILPGVASKDMRSRYLMPIAGPLVLILALAVDRLWRVTQSHYLIRGGIIVGGGVWLILFALPFAYTTLVNPMELELSRRDTQNYLSGNFAGDAFRQTAALLDRIDPPPGSVYASYGTCQALFFFTARPVHCLKNSADPVELRDHPLTYVIFNGHELPPDRLGLDWKLLAQYDRPRVNRVVSIWQVHQ
jgi:hypothetical protein